MKFYRAVLCTGLISETCLDLQRTKMVMGALVLVRQDGLGPHFNKISVIFRVDSLP